MRTQFDPVRWASKQAAPSGNRGERGRHSMLGRMCAWKSTAHEATQPRCKAATEPAAICAVHIIRPQQLHRAPIDVRSSVLDTSAASVYRVKLFKSV